MAFTLEVRNHEHNPIYDILIRSDFSDLSSAIQKLGYVGKKICIVSDSNTVALFFETVKKELGSENIYSFVFDAGEKSKNLNTVNDLYEYMISIHMERKDLMVALGGGVVGDLCGFAAATYLRGICFIQIPTSLLSQVDSSIGGKTGVDYKAYKNMVGAFKMPALVYINSETLKTLPKRELASGMGEIIKHGLIADKKYYEWLLDNIDAINNLEPSEIEKMVTISDQIKGAVVETDPFEQSIRKTLNYGHTLGHAIEKNCDFSYSHGACVGLGMLAAMNISITRGLLTADDLNTLKNMMVQFGLPVSIKGIDKDKIIEDTHNDKKMNNGHIQFVLLDSIGHAYVDDNVSEQEMRGALESIYEE